MKNVVLVCFLIFLLTFFPNPSWSLEPDPQSHLQKGFDLLQKGELDEAKKEFLEALLLDPKNRDAHFYLGNVLQREGRLEEALEQYQHVLKEDPLHFPTRYNLGLIFESLGRFEDALKEYQTVIRQGNDPTLIQGAETRLSQIGDAPEKVQKVQKMLEGGKTLLEQGNLEKSKEIFEGVLLLLPLNVFAHFNLGIIFSKQNELDKAIQEYQMVLEQDPNYLPAYFNLGLLYEDMSQVEKAIAQYQEILRYGEGIPFAREAKDRLEQIGRTPEEAQMAADRLQKSQSFLLRGELGLAKEEADAVLTLAPQNLGALEIIGLVYFQQGGLHMAISSFQEILKIDPGNITSLLRLGLIYEGRGQLKEALKNFLEIVKIGGNAPPIQLAKLKIAVLLKEMNQRKMAEKGEQKFNEAIQSLEKGEIDIAVKLFEEVDSMDPTNPFVPYNLGIIYAQRGDAGKAIIELQKAIHRKQDYVSAHYRLGLLNEILWNVSVSLPEKEREEYRREAILSFQNVLTYGKEGLEVRDAEERLNRIEKRAGLEQEVKGHSFLSREMFRAERLDEALFQAELAVQKLPNSPTNHYQIGLIYEKKGMEKEAIEAYEKSLELNPALISSHIHLGAIEEKKGHWEKAKLHYIKASEKSPTNPLPHYYLAVLYDRQTQYQEAIHEYSIFLSLQEKESEATEFVNQRLENLRQVTRKFSLRFSQNFSYDSNINSTSTQERSEFSAGFNLSLNYYPVKNIRWSVPIDISTSNIQFIELQTFVSSNSGKASFNWNPSDAYNLGLTYRISYSQTDNGPSSYQQTGSFQVSRAGSYPSTVSLNASYGDFTSLLNSNFDAFRQTYSLSMSQRIGKMGSLNFSYGYDNNEVFQIDRSTLSHSFSLVHSITLMEKLFTSMTYRVSLIDFPNPQIIPSTTGQPLTTVDRKNTFSAAGVNFSYIFKRGLSLNLSYQYIFNRSSVNIPFQEDTEALLTEQIDSRNNFKKSIISLSLSQTF